MLIIIKQSMTTTIIAYCDLFIKKTTQSLLFVIDVNKNTIHIYIREICYWIHWLKNKRDRNSDMYSWLIIVIVIYSLNRRNYTYDTNHNDA